MMDNRLFNVNGKGSDLLLSALELAFKQFSDTASAEGWKETEVIGLELMWSASDDPKAHRLPAPIGPSDCVPLVEKWLLSDFAKNVRLSERCTDIDQDGHNERGWQVYTTATTATERSPGFTTICAIRPAYLWFGK